MTCRDISGHDIRHKNFYIVTTLLESASQKGKPIVVMVYLPANPSLTYTTYGSVAKQYVL